MCNNTPPQGVIYNPYPIAPFQPYYYNYPPQYPYVYPYNAGEGVPVMQQPPKEGDTSMMMIH